MDNRRGYTLEGGGRALLLLRAYGLSPGRLKPLAGALREAGLTVCVPALFEPGANWTSWLRETRAAFTALRDAHVSVSLCGLGEGIGMALLLAGEYSAEQLLLSPLPPAPAPLPEWFGLRALDRRARRGLFTVACPAHILVPEGAPPVVARQACRLSRMLGRCTLADYPREAFAATVARRLLAAD